MKKRNNKVMWNNKTVLTRKIIQQFGLIPITTSYNNQRIKDGMLPVKPNTVYRYGNPGERYHQGPPKHFYGYVENIAAVLAQVVA